MPLLRHNGERKISARQQTVGYDWNLHGGGIPDRFGQEADHVVEIHGRSQAAVPPRGVVRPTTHRRTRFSLDDEAVVHRRTDEIDADRHERIHVVVERITEWWREHHRPRGAGLVMVVHDLRMPRAEEY